MKKELNFPKGAKSVIVDLENGLIVANYEEKDIIPENKALFTENYESEFFESDEYYYYSKILKGRNQAKKWTKDNISKLK